MGGRVCVQCMCRICECTKRILPESVYKSDSWVIRLGGAAPWTWGGVK